MIANRPSNAVAPNPELSEQPRTASESNSAWLARALGSQDSSGTIVLIGGVSLTEFRIRVAQSHARQDLLPSFWSYAALIRGNRQRGGWDLYEVSLEPPAGFGFVPANNGVQQSSFSHYDDPARYPNIACIRFTVPAQAVAERASSFPQALESAVATFRKQRSLVDLTALLIEWLGFVWGAGDKGNPLLKGLGVPSAVFLESVFAIAGVELTPGLASQSSCPETIWQAAKWWHEFYESEAALTQSAPQGSYFIGQPSAAVVEGEDAVKRTSKAPGRSRRKASR